MDTVFLRFYVHEQQRLHWKPLWEWLLEEANRMGVAGGSGSARDGRLRPASRAA
jgi:PII-like signaling protein